MISNFGNTLRRSTIELKAQSRVSHHLSEPSPFIIFVEAQARYLLGRICVGRYYVDAYC